MRHVHRDDPSRQHRFMRASAGTGKTYQLVQAYIGHVRDGGLSPASIVAITFTRKAAAELRSRIRAGLIEQGAGRATLDALARAPIANFHGLALQMLQSFGAEVGFIDVPQIMGDLGEDERLFRIACEEAWFGTNAVVHEALAAVSLRMRIGERGRGVSFVDAVWRAVAAAREDDDPRPLAERFALYDPRATQRRVHTQCIAFRGKLAAGWKSLGDKTRHKAHAFLEHGEPTLGDDLGVWMSRWQAAFDELKGAMLKGIATADERNELVAALSTPFTEAVCAELAPHIATLMQSAVNRYSDLKRETRSCDFPDLLEQTSAALERDPALHARVRERFKVVLVDEAQDTNASQRRFVRLIAGLEGPACDSDQASLFVVGDKKQAIYTFRGADPRSFALFESDLTSLGASLEDLTVSRRSAPGVVRGVNHLGVEMLSSAYEALDPLPGRADLDATPALTWLVAECESEANASERGRAEARAVAALVRRAVDAGGDPSSFAILLRATTKAQTFARALAALGLPSVITGGGGFYAQTEVVDLIALLAWLADPEALFDAAVAMRSPLIGFSDSALLHLFGAGDRSRLQALRRGDASSFVSTNADDYATARVLASVLPELVTAVANMGAGRSVSRVLDALDARAVLLALPFGEQKLANIERFAELAWNHERNAGRGTPHFVHEQREHARRGASEPLRAIGAARDRAVSIMTVHQSKGLEFDHVILADLSQERQGDGAPIVHSRELGFVFAPERRPGSDPEGKSLGKTLKSEAYRKADATLREEQQAEMRRLLYVATTRAREKLTFVATDGARNLGFARVLNAWMPKAIEAGVMRRLSEAELGEVTAPAHASLPAALVAAPPLRCASTATSPAVAEFPSAFVIASAGRPVVSSHTRVAMAAAGAKRKRAAAENLALTGQLNLFAMAGGQGASLDEQISDALDATSDIRDPTSDARAPTSELRGAVHGLRDLRVSAAPAGTRFALSVTDLENAIAHDDATKTRLQRRAALESDMTLDPLARGRLTHMVLAALHRLPRHASFEHFIDAELRTCGYDPTDPRLADVRDDLQAFSTSPLGREVTQLVPDARRHEMPFVLPFMVDPYIATVTGQIDLVYWANDEPVIVDFKHAHASSAAADAYAVQLDAYAVAIARLCHIDGPIRTRLVFLRDRAAVRDRIVTKAMRNVLHHYVEALVRELAVLPNARSGHLLNFGAQTSLTPCAPSVIPRPS